MDKGQYYHPFSDRALQKHESQICGYLTLTLQTICLPLCVKKG